MIFHLPWSQPQKPVSLFPACIPPSVAAAQGVGGLGHDHLRGPPHSPNPGESRLGGAFSKFTGKSTQCSETPAPEKRLQSTGLGFSPRSGHTRLCSPRAGRTRPWNQRFPDVAPVTAHSTWSRADVSQSETCLHATGFACYRPATNTGHETRPRQPRVRRKQPRPGNGAPARSWLPDGAFREHQSLPSDPYVLVALTRSEFG